MCFDFTKNRSDPKPVCIKGEVVDRVDRVHEYLDAIFDNKVCWNEYDSCTIRKANTRLYRLRKLRSFGVSTSLLAIFYNAVVCSAFTLALSAGEGIFLNTKGDV